MLDQRYRLDFWKDDYGIIISDTDSQRICDALTENHINTEYLAFLIFPDGTAACEIYKNSRKVVVELTEPEKSNISAVWLIWVEHQHACGYISFSLYFVI